MVGLGLGLGMEKRPDSRITQKSDEQPAPSPIPPEPEQVNDPRMNSPQRAGVIGIMRVWANFSPGLADEIELKVGDQVIVDEIHEDGWALGTNVSSGRSGMLPMAVLLQESNSVSAVDALRFTSPLSQGRIRTVTNSTVSGEMTQESGFQAYNATPPTSYPQLFPEVFTSQLLLHRQQYLRTNTAPRRTASVLSARRSTQILSPSPSQGSLNRPSLSHRPSVLSSHASSGTVMPSSGNHLQSIHPSLTRSNSVTSSASSPIPTPTPSDFLSLPRVGAAPPRIPTLISKRSSNEAVPSVFDSLIEMIHDVSANTPPGSAAATFPAMAGSHDEDFSTPSLSPPTTTPSSSAESNHSMFSEMATFIPTPSASLVSAGTVADDKGAEISDFADYLDFWTSSTDETSSTLEPPRPAASHVVLSERKTAPSAGTTSTLVELDDKLRQGLLSGPEYLRQRDMLMGK
ncbi:hypothetical protein DFJ73DRAFT_831286 [Zopfochytrium polystomum]|nr:hypothetical protein DFJ73DRAFT_831286 [Zopfochytrium polystomum]